MIEFVFDLCRDTITISLPKEDFEKYDSSDLPINIVEISYDVNIVRITYFSYEMFSYFDD